MLSDQQDKALFFLLTINALVDRVGKIMTESVLLPVCFRLKVKQS